MLSMPKVIDIELELTTLCNAHCQLCYRNYKSFKNHYPETKIRSIDEVIRGMTMQNKLDELAK